ncbi:hypothetical protein PP655_gp088 [Bacillus phage PBC4]|uniref:Uncharacterized protein n=1 Tax=Bacillus phage PBC4 TaxID=1675028 RepID=A0A1D6X8D1_9CAUD|nr:hypothetical protein PP655_gp088 [Bacillus phage PBC4]AKQ08280.1 hypothetical protein PBC4_088 [Bacillus phage PBC4]
MEIVKFNSKFAEHEFHISNTTVINEFRTVLGKRVKLIHTKKKPRKIFKDKKGEFIKLSSGSLYGNKIYKHYLNN